MIFLRGKGIIISKKDVEQLENLLLIILENNLNYRRYKDEEY